MKISRDEDFCIRIWANLIVIILFENLLIPASVAMKEKCYQKCWLCLDSLVTRVTVNLYLAGIIWFLGSARVNRSHATRCNWTGSRENLHVEHLDASQITRWRTNISQMQLEMKFLLLVANKSKVLVPRLSQIKLKTSFLSSTSRIPNRKMSCHHKSLSP